MKCVEFQDSLGYFRSDATEIQFREEKIPIYRTPSDYHQFGIVKVKFDELGVVPYARLLFAMHREKFFASEKEIRTCIPDRLPCILSLDQWHHRDFTIYRNRVVGDLPSTYETYPMLAEVLVFRNTSLYKPTLPPNTGWEHWPQSGSL